ncbi:uncharacterized protein BXIN_2891 [Babesia sp. Xinjiang]|uniref:uncharacterized protein n=1 Tax=Babesia sp. Xinjiang TaxID=462227 RepID=UPI000A217B59|nr:uncharacterized protein BXIN_2891 [Babesia sp. Xinjiang]ORM39497.1 hypothetical protein BXIN_2891 [Babesia sp. Xinjiang]
MTATFSNLNLAICAVLLVISISPIHSITLQLNETEFPSSIDVFEGKFERGGIYRMFHAEHTQIDCVKYRDMILTPSRSRKRIKVDTYVQEYRRGENRVISITLFYLKDDIRMDTTFYQITDNRYKVIALIDRNKFVGKTVILNLDVGSHKIHPFIGVNSVRGARPYTEWSVMRGGGGIKSKTLGHRVKYRTEHIILTPIQNIEKTSRSNNSPPTKLSSNITKILIGSSEGNMRIWLKYKFCTKSLSIQIPPIYNGVFRPRNIVLDPLQLSQCDTTTIPTASINVEIDISNNESITPHVIVLANLRRGDWLYSQHSIVPFIYRTRAIVKVVNSTDNCEIYQMVDERRVTHIEIFDHVKHGWQYVVINIVGQAGIGLRHIKKIYKRIDDSNFVAYFDLSKFWINPYIDMLYNIDTLEPDGDNEPTDVMMDAMST